MRESVVEEIVQEIVARLQGLQYVGTGNGPDGIARIIPPIGRTSKPNSVSKPNEDDDESTTQEVAKLIGGGAARSRAHR